MIKYKTISSFVRLFYLPCVVYLLALFCSRHDIWTKIRQGDFEIVEKGTYHGRLKYLPRPVGFEKLIEKYRGEIERHIDLLPVMTKRFFVVAEDLNYIYKFTWVDEERDYLVLRYFAPIFYHRFLAGYQIQFVFDTKTDKIVKIFVSGVPLE